MSLGTGWEAVKRHTEVTKMGGLIGLGFTVICLVGAIIQRIAPAFKAEKPRGFHYPIAQAGFESSPYLSDYDYFEPSRFTEECVCGTCTKQRFLIQQSR